MRFASVPAFIAFISFEQTRASVAQASMYLNLRRIGKFAIGCLLLSLTLGIRAEVQKPPYAAGELHDLRNLEQFRALFDEEKGTYRLILLVSPT
jgi:hypothetical protein